MASESEGVSVVQPVDGVSQKQSTEKHDLGDEKDPHAEVRGFALLLEAVELVGESLYMPGGGIKQLLAPSA